MLQFSVSVKEEILSNMNSRPKCDACILGMLLFCKKLTVYNIEFLTENQATAQFLARNLGRISGNNIDVIEYGIGSRKMFSVKLVDTECIKKIFAYFKLDESKKHQRFTDENLPKQKYLPQIVSGAYLACGSVNDPNKSSHLEFVVPTLDLCNDLGLLLIDNYGIIAKQMSRGKNEIVYLKDSENIQDVLTIIGAQTAALKHITIKVDKEGTNQINRSINCATANFKKSSAAAKKQLDSIKKLRDNNELEKLPSELQIVANVRLQNPDLSLNELVELIDPPISKSGLNHRLNKLIKIAENQ